MFRGVWFTVEGWGFQNPIIKEYTLNHIGDPIII